MRKYILNLNAQSNGDYEVHETICTWKPISNYEDLGYFPSCTDAVIEARRRHPSKRINGCFYCSKSCHTS